MFNRAIKMFEAQLARDPAYIEPRFCLAASHIWMGEAFARTGNTAQALSSYQTGMAGWDPLALNDEGTSAQAVVAGLRIKISLLLAKMGKREPASEDAERGLKIAQSITAANPNILEAQYVLADAYSGLADLSQLQASDGSQPAQRQIRYWNEARIYYQRSLNAWKGIQNPGVRTPVGFACGNPKQIAQEIAKCDAALARLRFSSFR